MNIISSFTIIDISEFKKVIKNAMIKDALFIMTITKHKLVIVGIKEDASVVIRSSMARDMLNKFVPPDSSFSFSLNSKRFMKIIDCADDVDKINFVIKKENLEFVIENQTNEKIIFDIVQCPQPKIEDTTHDTIIKLNLSVFLDLISNIKHLKSDVVFSIKDNKVIISGKNSKTIELTPNEIQGKKSSTCCLQKKSLSYIPNKTNSIGTCVCIYITDNYPILLHYEDKAKTYIILKTINNSDEDS